MRRYFILFFLVFGSLFLLSACSGNGSEDPASKAVKNYLQAIVSGDSDKLSSTSCKEWESQAMLEMDSFTGVKAKVDQAICKSTSTDGKTSQVECTGKILATYNNEQQEFDLSGRTYVVNQVGGEWLVCGYK